MANTKGKNDTWMQMVRRNSVVAAVVLFVCVAVYLNWNYQNGGQTDAGKTLGDAALVAGEAADPLLTGAVSVGEQSDTTPSGYFANARLNRQQARDSALSLLQEASANAQADQTMKEQTTAAIQTMADFTVTEAQIENLVIAKGYADCVAFIGEQSLSLAVAAPEAGLTQEDTARILDVVQQVSDFTAGQVKIIGVE